mmetsp:Transcript_5147/g.10184  ORF Transcript_5147/g.10184 Transcript_5147/m.10184 type:complete len:89 (+) Transcript_5147:1690-1956(+)
MKIFLKGKNNQTLSEVNHFQNTDCQIWITDVGDESTFSSCVTCFLLLFKGHWIDLESPNPHKIAAIVESIIFCIVPSKLSVVVGSCTT